MAVGDTFLFMQIVRHVLALMMAAAAVVSATSAAPDYGALYAKGVTYDAFMTSVRARRATWEANTAAARVAPEIAERARSLTHTWKILAVAVDTCSDSVASVPYVAKLVDASPATLSLRIVDNEIGRPAMEANRTPDGRAATPTLILMRDDGVVHAWVERPGALVAWINAQRKADPNFDLLAGKTQWYAEDAGRSTLADLLTLLEAPQ